MAAFGVVLLVVIGLALCALVLVTILLVRETGIVRQAGQGVPSTADLEKARRHAYVVAFREAELAELASQGPLIDRDLPADVVRLTASPR